MAALLLCFSASTINNAQTSFNYAYTSICVCMWILTSHTIVCDKVAVHLLKEGRHFVHILNISCRVLANLRSWIRTIAGIKVSLLRVCQNISGETEITKVISGDSARITGFGVAVSCVVCILVQHLVHSSLLQSPCTPHLPLVFCLHKFLVCLHVGLVGSGGDICAAMGEVNCCLLISQIVDKCYWFVTQQLVAMTLKPFWRSTGGIGIKV